MDEKQALRYDLPSMLASRAKITGQVDLYLKMLTELNRELSEANAIIQILESRGVPK